MIKKNRQRRISMCINFYKKKVLALKWDVQCIIWQQKIVIYTFQKKNKYLRKKKAMWKTENWLKNWKLCVHLTLETHF